MMKNIKETVEAMKVAEMRKAAGKYGIKNASQYKRVELQQKLIEAMELEEFSKKVEKASKKAKSGKKATAVSDEQAEQRAEQIVTLLEDDSNVEEHLMSENRKVLIQLMKMLHCKRWYRTYDKPTMIKLIVEKITEEVK